MPVEMACGSCEGRFVVAAAGTVACPHCGVHLAVSADMLSQSDDANAPATETDEPLVTENAAKETDGEELFAGYAGLADAAQAVDVEAGPIGMEFPSAEGIEEAKASEETVAPDVSAEEMATIQLTDMPADDPSIASGDEPPVAIDSPAAAAENAATIPGFSALEAEGVGSVPEELPAELPSFDFEANAATITFEGSDQPVEEISADDLPAAMFAEGDSPFGDPDGDHEMPDAFPDFGASAEKDDEDDRDGVDAILADATTTAANVEVMPTINAEQAAQELIVTVASIATPQAVVEETVPTQGGVSSTRFFILASYASAVTIVCLWLLYQLITGTHQMENLRDPADAPQEENKKYVQIFQIDATMPRGHVLQLGDSRQFGNILVEPIKVTRGLLDFVPYSKELGMETIPPDANEIGPTLKLWLRLSNKSDDQNIAPLDSLLLYGNRVRNPDNYEDLRGNTFVCRANDKKKNGNLVYAYSLNLNKSWDLRGQNLKRLAPGESLVTYIAAGPNGIDKLKGKLVWRVHFRKGYSPSGLGVTTLFEVDFDRDEIKAEQAATS